MTNTKRVLSILLRIFPLVMGAVAGVVSVYMLVMTLVFNNTAVPVEAKVDAVSGKFASISYEYNGVTESSTLNIDRDDLRVGDLAAIWVCPSAPNLFSVQSSKSVLSCIGCVILSFIMLICSISLFKSGVSNTNIKK